MADDDPFLWLEEVEGERGARLGAGAECAHASPRSKATRAMPDFTSEALGDHQRHRPHSLPALARRPHRQFLAGRDAYPRIMAAHDAGPRIATRRSAMGTDPRHRRARRCRGPQLGVSGRHRIAAGVSPLPVGLSDGGKDAAEWREFDLEAREFVGRGFFLPEGKQSATSGSTSDTLLVARDWGPGTMTASGYPFILKRWRRGTPLDGAEEIFRGTPDDVSVSASVLRDPDGAVRGVLVNPPVNFFESEHLPAGRGRPGPPAFAAEVELSAALSRPAGLLARRRSGGNHAGRWCRSISLACLADPPALASVPIVAPGPRETIEDVAATRTRLLVDDLPQCAGQRRRLPLRERRLACRSPCRCRNNASVAIVVDAPTATTAPLSTSPASRPRTRCSLPMPTPAPSSRSNRCRRASTPSADGRTIRGGLDRRHRGALFHRPPEGAARRRLGPDRALRLWRVPGVDDAVLCRRRSASSWLEQGGVYVVANIRGGGEFGPNWHQAALKARPPARLRRFHRGRRGPDPPRHHQRRAGSASWAARTAAC